MSVPGRRPTPTALKLLQGIPGGKSRIRDDEPQPEVVLPDCPDHISGHGREEWERIVPLLHKYGLLTTMDLTALEMYCTSYNTWREAQKKLDQDGFMTLSVGGSEKPHPAFAVARNAYAELRAMLTEFGMTPSSRSRVGAKPEKKQDDSGGFK